MRNAIGLMSLAALAWAMPAAAQSDAATEPVTHPDWAEVAEAGVAILRNSLIDPESLTIEWVSGFGWGYRKPVIGRRTYGWIACGNYNARNQFGGYVGAAGFTLVHTPSGKTSIYEYGDGYSTCARGLTPVNPELIEASEKPKATFSVADELAKLDELRTQGIITNDEFEAQKAKLLSR